MFQKERKLGDLDSIGKAMLRDFDLLGIKTVQQLSKQNARSLYLKLEELTGSKQDPCVLDTFEAAVAQAKDPNLPKEKRQWWYWSRKRKAQTKSHS